MDIIIGFITALFFGLLLPLVLHGGLGFLGYDTLAAHMSGLMGTLVGAVIVELVLYLILSYIVFALYSWMPFAKKKRVAHGKSLLSSAGWFLLGNILGYCLIAIIVVFALSAWRGPAL